MRTLKNIAEQLQLENDDLRSENFLLENQLNNVRDLLFETQRQLRDLECLQIETDELGEDLQYDYDKLSEDYDAMLEENMTLYEQLTETNEEADQLAKQVVGLQEYTKELIDQTADQKEFIKAMGRKLKYYIGKDATFEIFKSYNMEGLL